MWGGCRCSIKWDPFLHLLREPHQGSPLLWRSMLWGLYRTTVYSAPSTSLEKTGRGKWRQYSYHPMHFSPGRIVHNSRHLGPANEGSGSANYHHPRDLYPLPSQWYCLRPGFHQAWGSSSGGARGSHQSTSMYGSLLLNCEWRRLQPSRTSPIVHRLSQSCPSSDTCTWERSLC